MNPLLIATACLYVTILTSAGMLMTLGRVIEGKEHENLVGMLLVQFIPFAFGLVFICFGIVLELML